MAEVTGPISSLPGSAHNFPDGTMCDQHPDRPAVVRIQGETDSMGCELNDLCEECLEEHREHIKTADRSGVCDWCGVHRPRLSPRRDYEEGFSGRVYDVCSECIKQENDDLAAELASYDDWD